MLSPPNIVERVDRDARQVLPEPLQAELQFYGGYAWCLNPNPTVAEVLGFLRSETAKLNHQSEPWQTEAVATNIYLLSCAVLNCTDEYLRGKSLRVPRKLAASAPGRGARYVVDTMSANRPGLAFLRSWRDSWVADLHAFLGVFIRDLKGETSTLVEAAKNLSVRSQVALTENLLALQISIPSPFQRLDLTHHDVLALGAKFIVQFPDRAVPLVIVGLRTSGSYFGPLLRALFEQEGYNALAFLTIEPNKGLGRQEKRELERYAQQGYTALAVDDPPNTAGTVLVAIEVLRRCGFARDRIKLLVPMMGAPCGWSTNLPDGLLIALESQDWHMRAQLAPDPVLHQLTGYFESDGFSDIRLIEDETTTAMNDELQSRSPARRGSRLKRIFAVRATSKLGRLQTHYVLAKSSGWGWLGYPAFIAGTRLSGLVPRVVGLRNGILYSHWEGGQVASAYTTASRADRIAAAATYIAARVRLLPLGSNPLRGRGQHRHHNGIRLLEQALSRAHGRVFANTLMQARLGQRLRDRPCAMPTLVDGNMQISEWISGPEGLLKTGYEHHGLGKAALNVADPAYDLAETALSLSLDPAEQDQLVARYRDASGDAAIGDRLFLHKLLAGLWAMDRANDAIFSKDSGPAEQCASSDRFMQAWHFLTVETARHCGRYISRPQAPSWSAMTVVLDVDGVIDRRLFGFPCTTAAGIEALSLLHTNGISIALNTARSADEVKAYCSAYGLSGGIAEYGSYLWDSVAQRGHVLVHPESLRQLDILREYLRPLPGVFLDKRHRYSIKAFSYQATPRGALPILAHSMRASNVGDGALCALPDVVINHAVATLGLDRLSVHQTSIDTTIIARDVDKGSGLATLRNRALAPSTEIIAVGDSDMDLAMFRQATRSFAPANITCRSQARLLGCQVSESAHQTGLLEIARIIVSENAKVPGNRTPAVIVTPEAQPTGDIFLDLLRTADRPLGARLAKAVFSRSTLQGFFR